MRSGGATRISLLVHREQIRIALDGVRLLKSKREALLKEFLATADTALSSRSELEARCREATNTLNLARGLEGPEPLRSSAMAARRTLTLDVTEKRVWGIAVPEIRYRGLVRSPEARGYGLAGTGILIDETATAFEKILQQALSSAMEEIRLRKIGNEIKKTSRRVNALEQILVPSLRREIDRILQLLEERSREDIFRLKRLKAKKKSGVSP